MTYYELMNTLESIRISPRNSEYINKLNSTTLLVYNDIEPNIKGFIEKIMIYRLSNELNNLLNRIYSIDYDNLSLELVEFQREVIYLEELSKIKIIKDNFSIHRLYEDDLAEVEVNDYSTRTRGTER